MSKKNRTYTQEFKLEALELLKTSGKSAAQLAPSDMAAAQAEIRRLRRELAVAQQERDILKKAVSIFSQLER